MTPSAGSARDGADAVVDTGVAVAALVADHQDHAAAAALLDGARRPALAGHAWFESYSVLTRLPAPLRLGARTAATLLGNNFESVLWLDARQHRELTEVMAEARVAGGAVYDALVGWVAACHGLPLLSLDTRARSTYASLGVTIRSSW